jgi:hypothetical protein
MRATKPTRQERPLAPVHHSIAGARILPRPQCMDSIRIPYETRAALSKVALNIFTDMTNSNRSFRDALLAIYLSGLAHGCDIAKED